MQNTVYIKHEIANVINIAKIITIHYFEYGKDYKFGGESHDFWEIMYSDKGHVCITSGEHEFMLEQGEMVFLRPDLYHDICSDGKHGANVFIISFDTNSSAMRYFEDKVIKIPDSLKGLISQIIAEGKSAFVLPMPNTKFHELIPKEDSMIGAQQLIRLNLEQFLILLLRYEQQNKTNYQLFTSKSKFDNHIAIQIKKLLEDNLFGKITVSQISEQLHYGKTHLSAAFKKIYNRSIIDYYTYIKIEEAKRLIREQNYSITEISAILKFDTPQYFSKRFKQYVFMSPTEYLLSVKID